MNTKWMGLWAQDRPGFYAGRVIAKKDIPAHTRIILRYNKFYEKGSRKPRFIVCFADSRAYKDKCVHIEIEERPPYEEDGKWFKGDGERLYTEEEVYEVIHGMQNYHGLSYGDDLIEDYIP